MVEQLIQLVSELVRMNHELIHEIREDRKQITHKLEIIMSKISDFVAAQKAFNDEQSADIDSLVTSTAGITADVKSLNDKITELQNSSGGITAEDQALLDGIQADGAALSAKLKTATDALALLDAQTPPVVPVP